ncbi:GntR family transcriptional regulator [Amycolatopsis sp. GA6-003]|uniref:GntR family transcriptional regulator n=1 Tax=Amycolatopsis sp. GA6-003 TaxID=2652444 RepID=UPI0039171AAE
MAGTAHPELPGEDGGSLGDSAYESLRAMLMAGKFQRGDRLAENRVGEMLGVSRTPVREALARLAAEGLVEIRPNGSRVVADLWAKVAEVLAIRGKLEPFAVSLAAHRMTGEQFRALETLQDRMEKILPSAASAMDELLDLNQRFHWTIVTYCGNASLVEVLDRFRPFTIFPRILTRYPPAELELAIGEHRAIMDALWHRDAAKSEQLAAAHLERGIAAVRGVLDSR